MKRTTHGRDRTCSNNRGSEDDEALLENYSMEAETSDDKVTLRRPSSET